MIIPIYNETVLPCITYPFKPKKQIIMGFAGKGTQKATADIEILCENDTEVLALDSFFVTDLEYGTKDFLLDIPFFGRVVDNDMPTLLVRFSGHTREYSKESFTSQSSHTLEIVGEVKYIVNDGGDYVLNDSGGYIVSDPIPINNKEITYGN